MFPHKTTSNAYTSSEVYDMNLRKRITIIGILFVLCTGTLAHFLYQWSGKNAIVGLFTPINESVWEHMKLLFFPMLLYAIAIIIQFRNNFPCIVCAFCFGILLGTLLIPVCFYAYTAVLKTDVFLLDIATFVLSTILAFLAFHKRAFSCRLKRGTLFLCILVCIVFGCFLVFTYHPLNLHIFKDPTTSTQSSLILRSCCKKENNYNDYTKSYCNFLSNVV